MRPDPSIQARNQIQKVKSTFTKGMSSEKAPPLMQTPSTSPLIKARRNLAPSMRQINQIIDQVFGEEESGGVKEKEKGMDQFDYKEILTGNKN